MPLGTRIVRTLSNEASTLRDQLVQEWREPDPARVEPFIVEEQDSRTGTLRLYVFWRAWAGLPQRERSEVIMDAFEQARGPAPEVRVTLAMGLTPDEAERLGMRPA
jgi:hypothetical protein